MTRRRLLMGNWKLHHGKHETLRFIKEYQAQISRPLNVDVAIAPVALYLDSAQQMIQENVLSLAAQNVFYEDKGAFTGEWSARDLQELGVSYAIVGHSERRARFFETDEDVQKKSRALMSRGIVPVICVGETLQERSDGLAQSKIAQQITAVQSVAKDYEPNWVVAYEPIWAIGTGQAAKLKDIEEAAASIRGVIAKNLGVDVASKVRILYGGSVTPENIREIVLLPNMDGALVGGASLQVASFLSMVRNVSE